MQSACLLILLAIALVLMYERMLPRSRKDPVANPRSALNKLYAVAREHKKRGYYMAPLTLAMSVLKGARPPLPHWVPPPLAELVRACWDDNPSRRPPFEAVRATTLCCSFQTEASFPSSAQVLSRIDDTIAQRRRRCAAPRAQPGYAQARI